MMRIVRFAVLALALAPWIVFLAGCGGSSERSDSRQDTRVETRSGARTEDRVENRKD
jgi:hypothetical protein